jgi:hypothetical protein
VRGDKVLKVLKVLRVLRALRTFVVLEKFHAMEVEFGDFPRHGTQIVRFFGSSEFLVETGLGEGGGGGRMRGP